AELGDYVPNHVRDLILAAYVAFKCPDVSGEVRIPQHGVEFGGIAGAEGDTASLAGELARHRESQSTRAACDQDRTPREIGPFTGQFCADYCRGAGPGGDPPYLVIPSHSLFWARVEPLCGV